MYWNDHKTKSENESMTKEYIYFLELNFVRLSIYSNQDDKESQRCYLPKGVIKNHNVITNGKT